MHNQTNHIKNFKFCFHIHFIHVQIGHYMGKGPICRLLCQNMPVQKILSKYLKNCKLYIQKGIQTNRQTSLNRCGKWFSEPIVTIICVIMKCVPVLYSSVCYAHSHKRTYISYEKLCKNMHLLDWSKKDYLRMPKYINHKPLGVCENIYACRVPARANLGRLSAYPFTCPS